MKIEFDLPNFEKEFSISIVLKRDGETISVVSSPSCSTLVSPEKEPEVKISEPKVKKKSSGGNMMDLSI